MAFVQNFLVPLIQIIFIGGIIAFIGYYIGKAFNNAWSKSWKFTWKYSIRKQKYSDDDLKWIMDCIDQGIGWYEAKKFLMIKMVDQKKIDEIMWIYDRVIIELNKNNQKGGVNHGRQFEGSHCKNESKSELPTADKSCSS